jgi:cytochrome c
MSQEEIAFWDRSITPDGSNLPAGGGSVKEGEAVYLAKCAACHGEDGRGQHPMVALAGGQGSLTTAKPIKTVGSYWPYATTLFDYIRRAMPFNQQKSLTDDEVYAVTAYTLFLNGIIEKNSCLRNLDLSTVLMQNRKGFVGPTATSHTTTR